MGFFDSFSELVTAATPWSTVEAEAPEKPEEKDDGAEVCVVFCFCGLQIWDRRLGSLRICGQVGSWWGCIRVDDGDGMGRRRWMSGLMMVPVA